MVSARPLSVAKALEYTLRRDRRPFGPQLQNDAMVIGASFGRFGGGVADIPAVPNPSQPVFLTVEARTHAKPTDAASR